MGRIEKLKEHNINKDATIKILCEALVECREMAINGSPSSFRDCIVGIVNNALQEAKYGTEKRSI